VSIKDVINNNSRWIKTLSYNEVKIMGMVDVIGDDKCETE